MSAHDSDSGVGHQVGSHFPSPWYSPALSLTAAAVPAFAGTGTALEHTTPTAPCGAAETMAHWAEPAPAVPENSAPSHPSAVPTAAERTPAPEGSAPWDLGGWGAFGAQLGQAPEEEQPAAIHGGLHPGLRAQLGERFGEDFSGVKIERGLSSQDQQRGVRAVSEPDKVAIDPATLDSQHEPESQAVIAEELAHVAQKRRGTVQPDAVDQLDDSHQEVPATPTEEEHGDARRENLESEAKEGAARAVAGERVHIRSGARAPRRQFGLWDKLKSAGSWVVEKAAQGTEWVGNKAEQASSWAVNKIDQGANWVEDKAGKAADWVGNKADQAANWVGDKVDKGWDWAADKVKKGAKWLGNTAVGQGAKWLGDKVGQGMSWLGDKAKQGVSWLGDKVGQGASWLGNTAVGKAVSNGVSWLGEKASQGVSWVSNKISSGTSWVADKVRGGASWLGGKVDQGLSWLGNTSVGKWAKDKGAWLMDKTQDGLRWAGDKVKKGVDWVAKSPIGKVGKGLYNIGQAVTRTASRWVSKGVAAFDRVVDWGEAKVGQATDWITRKTKDIPLIGPIIGLGAKYVKTSADFVGGVLKGAGGLVEGVANMALHPIDTLKGIGTMVEHLPMLPGVPNPLKLVHNLYDVAAGNKDLKDAMRDTFNVTKSNKDDAAFWQSVGGSILAPYKKSIAEGKPGEAAGRAAFEILLLIFSGGESAAARGGAEAGNLAAKTSEIANLAGKTEKVGEVANLAGKTEKVGEAASVTSKTGEVVNTAEKTGEAVNTVEKTSETVNTVDKTSEASKVETTASQKPLTAEQQRSVRSLEKRAAEHEEKLQKYLENPDAFDNKGFLKNASPEVRERIINGRRRHLQNEIDTFKKQIKETRGEGSIDELPNTKGKHSGGGKFMDDIDPVAEAHYDVIRAKTNDVAAVAKNTGLPQPLIEKIKNHLFVDEHQLASQLGEAPNQSRFIAVQQYADLWQEAEKGALHGASKAEFERLLTHENVEATLAQKGLDILEPEVGNMRPFKAERAHDLAAIAERDFPQHLVDKIPPEVKQQHLKDMVKATIEVRGEYSAEALQKLPKEVQEVYHQILTERNP